MADAIATAAELPSPSRGDTFNIARPDFLKGISGYSQEDQDDLLWLHGYTHEVLHASRSALVEFLGVDWSTIYRLFLGKYEADIGKIMERVRHLRRKS